MNYIPALVYYAECLQCAKIEFHIAYQLEHHSCLKCQTKSSIPSHIKPVVTDFLASLTPAVMPSVFRHRGVSTYSPEGGAIYQRNRFRGALELPVLSVPARKPLIECVHVQPDPQLPSGDLKSDVNA